MDIETLRQNAKSWMETDPDPWTRAATRALLDGTNKQAVTELTACFGKRLQFGTAGIRGVLGPGPGRMNRALVQKVTAGLASYLKQQVDDAQTRGVVVGHDARRGSEQFASDTAEVLSGAGFRVLRCPPFVPTPFVAFVARQLNASGAVVVTASHNPPEYNGYKVYWDNGAQIIAPHDVGIAAEIDLVGEFDVSRDLIEDVHDSLIDDYYAAIRTQIAHVSRGDEEVRVVYTPLHGVGGPFCEKALDDEGVTVFPVAEQSAPDGTFPTVAFPNPEEDGAMDMALALAKEKDADLILANDPDGDRLAAIVRFGNDFRPLTGDELGAVLADALLAARGREQNEATRAFVMNSIVSSELTSRVAAHYGARHFETLTGFKWIWNRALEEEAKGGTFAFGYEEALGYAVGPAVRDKDGISAALLMARLVTHKTTIMERLVEIWERHGYLATRQKSHVDATQGGIQRIADKMAELRANPPAALAGVDVVRSRDLIDGAPGLAPHNCLSWWLSDETRVMLRPSGTEPKLKVYLQVVEQWGASAELNAAQRLDVLEQEIFDRYLAGG